MRRKRAKWISQLIIEFNPYVYSTIHDHYGDSVKNRRPRTLYRIAKRLWNNHAKGTEKWKRVPMQKPQQEVKGELEANG
jgi:hypothetical protein